MAITTNATAITFNNGSVQTVAGGAGTVTSVATGNGLQGGTITSTGTLSVAAPGANTVGSYCWAAVQNGYANASFPSFGQSVAAGTGQTQFRVACVADGGLGLTGGGLSGTWRSMGASPGVYDAIGVVACRIS